MIDGHPTVTDQLPVVAIDGDPHAPVVLGDITGLVERTAGRPFHVMVRRGRRPVDLELAAGADRHIGIRMVAPDELVRAPRRAVIEALAYPFGAARAWLDGSAWAGPAEGTSARLLRLHGFAMPMVAAAMLGLLAGLAGLTLASRPQAR